MLESVVLSSTTTMGSHEGSRIKPGQYSRQPTATPVIPQRSSSPTKAIPVSEYNGKENESPTRGRQQVAVDPKYRLRGNSPPNAERSNSLFGSLSPIKSLRSRSRSRSRIFGSKDKTDTPSSTETAPTVVRTSREIDADFVALLDEMQVHPDLRAKLLALNSTVKLSMLQGQATLSLAGFSDSDAANSSSANANHAKTARKPIPELLKDARPRSAIFQRPTATIEPALLVEHGSARSKSSKTSLERTPTVSDSSMGSATGSRIRAMSMGEKMSVSVGKETPESFAIMLKCNTAAQIPVVRVKRMRAVVACESPAWISAFISPEMGGYDAMLLRLDELLGMEWREEQHDDMLLHELLRCFVAFNTTEIGRQALASQAPRPFSALVQLLFSEKKPGDLSTRKLVVDLLHILLHLQLPASQSHSASSLNYLLQLMQNPVDPAKEAVVDFIKERHIPRVFKQYVVEMATVCRDYFWIFCHSQNHFWRWEDLQDGQLDSIQGPKVPGGMTGGVEFEAIAYLTAHLRLLNALAAVLGQWKPHQLPTPLMTARELHANLFASGMERVIATLRRSSQHYYSTTHVELAKYLDLATRSGFVVPYHLTDWWKASTSTKPPSLPPIVQTSGISPAPVVTSGYGLASQFITPTTPIRNSSSPLLPTVVVTQEEHPGDTTPDEASFWNFDKPPNTTTEGLEETPQTGFSLADFDSQFFVFTPLQPLETKQLLPPPPSPPAPARGASAVSSAIKRWESMTTSQRP